MMSWEMVYLWGAKFGVMKNCSYSYHPLLLIPVGRDLEYMRNHYGALWVKAGVQAMLSLILNAKGKSPGRSA